MQRYQTAHLTEIEEVSGGARPLRAGRHQEVLAQAAPLLDADHPYPITLCTVAGSETALGDTRVAITHLTHAAEVLPDVRDYARQGPRLAPARQDPAFAQVTDD